MEAEALFVRVARPMAALWNKQLDRCDFACYGALRATMVVLGFACPPQEPGNEIGGPEVYCYANCKGFARVPPTPFQEECSMCN